VRKVYVNFELNISLLKSVENEKPLLLLIIASTVLFSCNQTTKEKLEKDLYPVQSAANIIGQKPPSIFDYQYLHTQYEYEDSSGTTLSLENSLPRGGHRYTDAAGKSFVYTIYWTRLSSRSASPLEVKINFPADSVLLTASSDIYFKLVLPPNKVGTAQKALINYDISDSNSDLSERDPVYNYGLLDLESVLNKRLHKSSSFHRIIPSKDTVSFYVINLFNKGVNGVVRTGLSLEEKELFYTVNGKKISVGKIEF
jgi:hypothetical protein